MKMHETSTRVLAMVAGCACVMTGVAQGGGLDGHHDGVMGSMGEVIRVSAPGEAAMDIAARSDRFAPFAPMAFGAAQVADARLQPVMVPVPDLRALADEDARAFDDGPAPYRIGVRVVPAAGPISADRDGIWDVLPDGSTTWTVRIEVPLAVGTSVEFTNLDLPAGSALLVRGADGYVQVWEGTGPNRNGYLQTPIVEGSWAEVQYVAPAGVVGAPGILISTVSHLYRLGGLVAEEGDRPSDERVDFGCHEDVMCHAADVTARDSVGRMFFSGGALCSGGLLADLDANTQKGWFLTANHCLSTQAAVNSLTIYWKYQKPACGGITPSLGSRPQSTGGTLIATSAQTDFTLLRTANDPNFPGHAAGSPTFAAWTTTSLGNGAAVRGIHHPAGEFKRYSEGVTTGSAPTSCLSNSFFYYGDWSVGITEGGSSGSPLFNSNWEVVGQLFGACFFVGFPPSCETRPTPNNWNWVYGRFNQTYGQNPAVSASLTTVQPDDAYEDNDTINTPAALPLGSHSLVLIDFDDYFQITVDCPTTLTVQATFTATEMDLDLYLYNQFNSQLAAQTGLGSPKTIVLAVNPGVYKVRTSKASGWGGNYTLNMTIAPGCIPDGVCCFSCNHALVPGTCPDGSNFVQSLCAEMSASECAALGGSYRGDNTTCASLANACLCPGDVNGDGDVNALDFNLLAGAFGSGTPGCVGRGSGDLNCDGVVNALDFNLLASNFGCDGN